MNTHLFKLYQEQCSLMYHKFGVELVKNPNYKIPQKDLDYLNECRKKMNEQWRPQNEVDISDL